MDDEKAGKRKRIESGPDDLTSAGVPWSEVPDARVPVPSGSMDAKDRQRTPGRPSIRRRFPRCF